MALQILLQVPWVAVKTTTVHGVIKMNRKWNMLVGACFGRITNIVRNEDLRVERNDSKISYGDMKKGMCNFLAHAFCVNIG